MKLWQLIFVKTLVYVYLYTSFKSGQQSDLVKFRRFMRTVKNTLRYGLLYV